MRSATVYAPNADVSTENDMASHKYSHHTRIWHYHSTTWIAFSSGCTNESDGGTQTAVCYSKDQGLTWSSPPMQAVPSQSKWTNGYAADRSTRLAYPRNWDFINGTNYLVVAVDSYDPTLKFVGEGLLARAFLQDGTMGALFRISTNAYAELDGKPVPDYGETNLCVSLMNHSKIYGCWGGTRYGATPTSEWAGWLFLYAPITVEMTEPNTFSADGTTNNLYRLWRGVSSYSPECVNCPKYVWQQMSTDGGATWSTEETQTQIPNTPSETVGRRLSTGQFVIVGNPQMYIEGVGVWRDPLFMAISAANSTSITNVVAIDQGRSGIPVYSGMGKGGGAQYPDCQQVGNYVYISYSITKESVGFSRVLIPGQLDNNNDAWREVNVGVLRIGSIASQ